MFRRGFAPIIAALFLLVTVTGISASIALVLNGTNFVNKASETSGQSSPTVLTWDDSCTTDSDCTVVHKLETGISCCSFGCGIQDYNDASWIAVNASWYQGKLSATCSKIACPMIQCAVQMDEASSVSPKCVFNRCQKIIVGNTQVTSPTPLPSPTLAPSPTVRPVPSTTCIPMPPCLYTKPYCYIAEPADGGWCPRPTGQPTVTPYPTTTTFPTVTPVPPEGCYYQQVQCIKAPCNPVLICPTTSVTPIPRPGNRYGQEKNPRKMPTPIMIPPVVTQVPTPIELPVLPPSPSIVDQVVNFLKLNLDRLFMKNLN